MRAVDPDARAWVDGKPVRFGQIRLGLDQGLVQSGDGLFETLSYRDGHVLDLSAHLDRVGRSAADWGRCAPDRKTMSAAVLDVASGLPDPGWIKLLLDAAGRWFVFGGAEDVARRGQAVHAVLLPWVRSRRDPLVGHKTTSYAASRRGLAYARGRGADEGLWRNERNGLTEGCIANLFLIRHRRLYTAALREGVLPGTLRARVLDCCAEVGLRPHVGRVPLKRLRHCDEMFLSSSLAGLRPVLSVDGKPIGNGQPGEWTRRLAAVVEQSRERTAPCRFASVPS